MWYSSVIGAHWPSRGGSHVAQGDLASVAHKLVRGPQVRRPHGLRPCVHGEAARQRPNAVFARRSGHSPLLGRGGTRSGEHTSELQSHLKIVCRLLLEKKKKATHIDTSGGGGLM